MRTQLDNEPKGGQKGTVDLEEISILLIGDADERKQAISLIHDHLRRAIVHTIRQVGLSLTTSDVLDVYQEVLLCVHKIAAEGRYDPDKPLLPFLLTLARRRVCDRIRKSEGDRKNQEALVREISQNLADTEVGAAWKTVAARHDGENMLNLIRQAIIKMPSRQRQVAEVMIENCSESLTLHEICEQVQRKTGEMITTVAAKSARQEVRDKIRELLERKGYMRSTTDDS